MGVNPVGMDGDCKNSTKNCEYTLKCDGPLKEVGNPDNV